MVSGCRAMSERLLAVLMVDGVLDGTWIKDQVHGLLGHSELLYIPGLYFTYVLYMYILHPERGFFMSFS